MHMSHPRMHILPAVQPKATLGNDVLSPGTLCVSNIHSTHPFSSYYLHEESVKVNLKLIWYFCKHCNFHLYRQTGCQGVEKMIQIFLCTTHLVLLKCFCMEVSLMF